MVRFLSARPGRGATLAFVALKTSVPVSIRTPRAGRDRWGTGDKSIIVGFYPHAPGGARLVFKYTVFPAASVSIRTPRAGRDAVIAR